MISGMGDGQLEAGSEWMPLDEDQEDLREWACTVCEQPAHTIVRSKRHEWTWFGLCATCQGLIECQNQAGLAARRLSFYVEEGPEAARLLAEQMIRS